MTNNDFKKMDVAELQKEMVALLQEQFNLRIQHATKQLTQTHNLKNVRRKIAQIKTVIHEKAG